jgi:hypothetical protein
MKMGRLDWYILLLLVVTAFVNIGLAAFIDRNHDMAVLHCGIAVAAAGLIILKLRGTLA